MENISTRARLGWRDLEQPLSVLPLGLELSTRSCLAQDQNFRQESEEYRSASREDDAFDVFVFFGIEYVSDVFVCVRVRVRLLFCVFRRRRAVRAWCRLLEHCEL